MEQRLESLTNLFKEAEVAKKLLSCTVEEVACILKEQYQLEFNIEELNEVAAGIKAALAVETSDELSSEQLEEVVGGAKSGAYYAGYYIGKTVQVGGVIIGIAASVVTLGW